MSANAVQLERLYDYQRTILNAFTEVINRISKVENYSRSIEIKKEQLASLEASVENATRLFQNARAEYIEVLFAQRDFMEARMVLIETKREQLSAIINAYQALGGGLYRSSRSPAAVAPSEPLPAAEDAMEESPTPAPADPTLPPLSPTSAEEARVAPAEPVDSEESVAGSK
jgi:hypothetical protein